MDKVHLQITRIITFIFDLQVVSSQTDLTDQKDWQELCAADDAPGAVAVTTDECQVRLQHFSLYTCLQELPAGAAGKKWLQVRFLNNPTSDTIFYYVDFSLPFYSYIFFIFSYIIMAPLFTLFLLFLCCIIFLFCFLCCIIFLFFFLCLKLQGPVGRRVK